MTKPGTQPGPWNSDDWIVDPTGRDIANGIRCLGPRSPTVAQAVGEPSADEIYEALTIAAEAVCEIRCPSKWKTSEPQPHSDECKKVRAARSAWMDHCSYQDLIASGGLPKNEGPELPSASRGTEA